MADPTNRLAGVAYVAIDGRSYAIVGEGTYRPSQENRETLLGQDGYHGYKAMPAAGMISWKGRDSGGVSVQTVAGFDNVTVTLELANGKTVIGRNMVRVGEGVEVNSEEGSYDIRWEGPEVTEN